MRTQLLTDGADFSNPRFALACLIVAFGCCAFTMELNGPESAKDLGKEESPYEIANVYSR